MSFAPGDDKLNAASGPHGSKKLGINSWGLWKIMSAITAICLILCLGLVHYQSSAVTRGLDATSKGLHFATDRTDQLETCAKAVPLQAQPPSLVNLWAPLTQTETSSVHKWLESVPGLNLTNAQQAELNQNLIYNIELLYPPKASALGYLDADSPAPERFARVTIHHGGENEPFVRDYVVGPLPLSDRSSVTPMVNTYHLQDGKVPFNARGLVDISDVFAFETILKPLEAAMKDLFGASFTGDEDNKSGQDTFVAGPSGPWSFDGSFRRLWVTWRYNTAGSFLHPIGFYNYIDISGTDRSLWKILRTVYHDQIFTSTATFLEAWKNGTLVRQPGPYHTSTSPPGTPPAEGQLRTNVTPADLEWSSRKRVGKPRDLDHLPGPRSVSFAGLRFRLDKDQQYISWMGWGFHLGFDRDMGPSLWDVRFKDERIAYQVAPQEAVAQYSGADPVQSATAWLDRHFGMGTLVRNLLPGYDCPLEAAFLPAETYHAHMGKYGAHIRRERAICIFEQDTGKALTRHMGDMPNETGAVKGYTLTVRSITSVGNYDYLFDYIFHLDGSMEVKVSASGYLQGGYWTEKQRPYGTSLRNFSMGSLHDHVINFKVDLDVAGTANSLLKTTTSQEEITLPWPDEDWGDTVIQQKITQEYISVEDDARLRYPRNFEGSYAIVNKQQTNKWGNPRGYIVHPGLSPVHVTAVGSKRMLKNANWAKYNLAVTRRKETEPTSSSMWNLHLPGAPAVDFDKFFDGDSIDQEDLVLWINVGTHHLPQAEDSPNTKTNVAASGFMLTPLNYFDSDPSMDLLNAIVLEAPGPNTGDTSYTFDDNGVRQDFTCVPNVPPVFDYQGEILVDESSSEKRDAAGNAGMSSSTRSKLRSVLYPLRIRTGI